MKKRIITLAAVLLLSFSVLPASGTTDLALMLGGGNFYSPTEGIAVSYGMTMGLTKTVELSFVGMSELIPNAAERNLFMLEVGMSVIGNRNTGSKVTGVCVNTILSLGAFYRTDDHGAGVYFGISPLTLGSPMTTRRERGLRTNIGYDFVNRKVMVTFSPLDIEIYITGTYRNWC